jgi:hypothetical protein
MALMVEEARKAADASPVAAKRARVMRRAAAGSGCPVSGV